MKKEGIHGSKEDYLKAILEADAEGREVIPALLAHWLEVSAPAVTMAMKRLKRDGLVVVGTDGIVRLTAAGRETAYHTALRRFMGAQRSASFERLYLLPGVYHCGGGEGPSAVDFLTPMMAWVEAGIAPQAVVTRQATQSSEFGQPTSAPPAAAGAAPAGAAVTAARTRPVYPYPYLAAYAGHGDPDRASSYVRADPIVEDDATPWAGEDFYRPYAALTR